MYQAGCPNLLTGQSVQPFRHLLRARLIAPAAGQSDPPSLVFVPPPTRTDCVLPAGTLAYNSSTLQLVDRFRLEVLCTVLRTYEYTIHPRVYSLEFIGQTIIFKFLRTRGAAQVTPSHTLRLELVTNASAVGAGVGATAWQLSVSYELLAAASNDSLSATGALPPNQCSGAPLFASRSAGVVSSPGYPTRRYRNSQVSWLLKHCTYCLSTSIVCSAAVCL